MKKVWAFLVAGVLTVTALPGVAIAADYQYLEQGTRGVDVAALQQLLVAKGYSLTVDGQFGPGTVAALQDFQAQNNLEPSGVAWSGTWRKLVTTVRRGSSGQAVRALQQQLNAKMNLSLATDGIFGAATDAAVRRFQQDEGLLVDGLVGPATWQQLVGHFAQVAPAGTGWYEYSQTGNWATANTVERVQGVASNWAALGFGFRLGLGDMSLQEGGYFAPHAAHQKGHEVDFRPIRKDSVEMPCAYTESCYDQARTQQLVNLMLQSGDVEVIYFNDPGIVGVKPLSGHSDHLHVRYKH